MKILIIEDEPLSARRLMEMVTEIDPALEVVSIVESVQGTLEILDTRSDIGLLFLDLHLSDGHGLEVLEKMTQEIPVIITTAYDEYALEAFQYLSVDYLLKPITEKALKRGLAKLKHYRQQLMPWRELQDLLRPRRAQRNLIGQRGKSRYPIPVSDIACCYTEERDTWCKTLHGKEYLVRMNLDLLEQSLDAAHFFRLNRQIVSARRNIEKFEILPKSRLSVHLHQAPDFDIVVSAEKAAAFKAWLRGSE